VGDHIVIEGVEGEIKAMDNSSFTVDTNGVKTIIPLHKLSTEKYQISKKEQKEEPTETE